MAGGKSPQDRTNAEKANAHCLPMNRVELQVNDGRVLTIFEKQ